MDPLTLATVGTSIYGLLAKPKRTNLLKQARGINTRFMAMNPGMALSAEDRAHVDRTLARGTRTASRSAQMGRQQAQRQIAARGLGGASAAALIGSADEREAIGRQEAADTAAGIEYGIGSSNRDFGRQKVMTAWGAELGAGRAQAAQDEAASSSLWNSILGAAPLIASSWGAVPAAAPGATPASPAAPASAGRSLGGASYNPSLSLYRRSVQPY